MRFFYYFIDVDYTGHIHTGYIYHLEKNFITYQVKFPFIVCLQNIYTFDMTIIGETSLYDQQENNRQDIRTPELCHAQHRAVLLWESHSTPVNEEK